MSAWDQKYSAVERDAITSAVLDRDMKMKRVVELAMAGELTTPEGTKLKAFTVPYSTVRRMKSREQQARLGKRDTGLSDLPQRDSTEILRRALVSAIEHKIAKFKQRLARDESSVSFEELRQGLRMLRELQQIPDRDEPRKPAPGQRVGGKQREGPTRTAEARAILAAHRGDRAATAQDDTHTQNGSTENGAAQNTTRPDDGTTAAQEEGEPGSVARAAATAALSTA